jgi:hypothetical protein
MSVERNNKKKKERYFMIYLYDSPSRFQPVKFLTNFTSLAVYDTLGFK